MEKKFLSILLTLVLVLGLLPAAGAAAVSTSPTFSDMPDNWATEALESAVANGLLVGDDGKIMPDSPLTRAQMATIIARAFGATEEGDISVYSDVKSTDWFAVSMAKAYKMGVMQGYAGKMDPNSNITREQAFAVLARALKLEISSSINKTFEDEGEISDWAKGEVYALVNAGYIQGSNGRLNPQANISRAEFAQMMHNLIKQYIKAEGEYTQVADGNIMVNVPNVTLKNVTITGDLIVGDGVGDGALILDNVTIKGRLVVRGGGVNSIIIIGGSVEVPEDGSTTNNSQGTDVITPPPSGGYPSYVAVSAITVEPAELTLTVGETGQITATVEPDNATNKDVTWTSSDENVATVNENGEVTAVAAGEATITVTTDDGNFTATTAVTVLLENTVAMIDTTQYESLADAIEATQDGQTVKLVADVELTSNGLTIETDKTVTLDLAGHVLSGVLDNEGASALITNNGSLTIEDTSAEKTGKITNQAENPDTDWLPGFPAYANNTITNSGELIIKGGRIENTTGEGASYVIDNNSTVRDAVVTVNDGYIVHPNGNFAIRQFANSTINQNSVTINGGIVEGTRAVWIQLPGSSGEEKLAELTVNGGTLKSTDKERYNLAVYSYTFGDSFAKTKITITGGTFDGDVGLTGGSPKAPMETVEVSDGAIFLGQRGVFTYANVVNETQNNGYTTIQAAIDDATAGDTILVAEGTYLESLTIPSGKEGLVLKSVSGADATVINGNIALGADNITIEGFTIGNSGARNGYVGLERTSGSKIINNIINGSKATVSIGNTTGNTVDSVTIEGNIINGGTIGLYPTSGSTITISNNTINSGNGEIIWIHGAEFKPTSLSLDIQGNIAIQEGDVITIHFKPVSINGVVDELEMISTIENDNEPVEVVLGWVKTVGATDADFTTIQAAIDAATAGDTIIISSGTYDLTSTLTINKSITVQGIDKEEVILKGANSITNTINLGDGATLKNVTVTRDNSGDWATNKNNQLINFYNSNYKTTTLEECIITGGRNGVYVNNKTDIVIKDNLIDNNRTGIQMANCNDATVENNIITNNHTMGVLLLEFESVGTGKPIFTGNEIRDNWYSDFENRWDAEYVVDLTNNTFTDGTYKVADTSGEPGYGELHPVELGGSATRPEDRTTFIMKTAENLILPSLD